PQAAQGQRLGQTGNTRPVADEGQQQLVVHRAFVALHFHFAQRQAVGQQGQQIDQPHPALGAAGEPATLGQVGGQDLDRKSTRLNSSHVKISYAVFCLKKKKNTREE